MDPKNTPSEPTPEETKIAPETDELENLDAEGIVGGVRPLYGVIVPPGV